jgi:hypothetical protein
MSKIVTARSEPTRNSRQPVNTALSSKIARENSASNGCDLRVLITDLKCSPGPCRTPARSYGFLHFLEAKRSTFLSRISLNLPCILELTRRNRDALPPSRSLAKPAIGEGNTLHHVPVKVAGEIQKDNMEDEAEWKSRVVHEHHGLPPILIPNQDRGCVVVPDGVCRRMFIPVQEKEREREREREIADASEERTVGILDHGQKDLQDIGRSERMRRAGRGRQEGGKGES